MQQKKIDELIAYIEDDSKIINSKIKAVNNFVLNKISSIFPNENKLINEINDKIKNLQVVFLNEKNVKEFNETTSGFGAAWYSISKNTIYVRDKFNSIYDLNNYAHELMHALSTSHNKIGPSPIINGKITNPFFNEQQTVRMTKYLFENKISGGGYNTSFDLAIQSLLGYSNNEYLHKYLSSDPWINKEVCNRFYLENPQDLNEILLKMERETRDSEGLYDIMKKINEKLQPKNKQLSEALEKVNRYYEFEDRKPINKVR